jgi:hypothetical protein
MADIRSIGTSVEAYAVDVNFYPRNITYGPVATTVATHVEPTFIRDAPATDGWGGEIGYGSDALGTEYSVRSYAKDRTKSTTNNTGKTTDFDCDIVYEVGGFVAWPEGIQT